MRLFLLVAMREYLSRMRSKIGILMLVIGLIAIIGGSSLVNILGKSQGAKAIEVTVLDQTGWALPALQATVTASQAAAAEAKSKANPIKLTPAAGTDEAALQAQVKAGEIKLLLVMKGKDPHSFAATFYSSSLVSLGQGQERLTPILDGLVRSQRIQAAGADPKVLQALTAKVAIDDQLLSSGGTENLGARMGVATAFLATLYMAIILFCTFVLQGVLEEKTSRVAELLVATVKPVVLMAGKVIGIGLVGLTLLLTWVGGYLLAQAVGLPVIAMASIGLGVGIWGWLLLFFILGYFLYASLFAAAGSSVSRLEEAQAATLPLMVPIVVAYAVSFIALMDPMGSIAVIFSFIPFTAPTVMLIRILLSEPAPWEIALSVALMVVTGIGTTWLSSRIYRAGILRYDGRMSVKGMLQSMRSGS